MWSPGGSRQNARHFDVTVWREICRSGPENFAGTRANTPLVCPREGLVEQQSLKEEIRFPILIPYGIFQPRTQHGKRPSVSINEKIDTGALPTLFFGPNPRPMKVLAARNTFEKNRHGVFDDRSVWVVLHVAAFFVCVRSHAKP